MKSECEQKRKQDGQDMLDTHDKKKERELPQSELTRSILGIHQRDFEQVVRQLAKN
ncbi:MAG TPA: hypothetical protein VLE96_07380 [Chlamydiales bacterium]|nr:hypothetical protein [Chlamydiales bacterium]